MKLMVYLSTRLAGLFAVALTTLIRVGAAEPVPPKTVVLTFDDAVKSHLEVVAPLLKEHGFGATFFITHAWMTDPAHFLSWDEVGQLHRMGFEIGNHSWTHAGFNTPRAAASLAGELALVENALARVGVPKPITFGWTGNVFGPEALDVLEKAGYRLARRGMQPEALYGSLELGPLFDPNRHHPLLIPSAGDAYPVWTLEHFRQVVDRAAAGHAVVVQFYGVPDVAHPWVHTPVERFREYLTYLKQGGFRVVAMRDLLGYLPEKPVHRDPMTQVRYPGGSAGEGFWPVEAQQTQERLEYWLPIMVRDHGYSLEEVMGVTALPRKWLEDRLGRGFAEAPATEPSREKLLRVRPYPGGRHPRIGFLEGAISPMRGTKVSLFPPWRNGGYAVLDLPEAIFSNLGLLFLAHTHVPTIWNDQNTVIENTDWIEDHDGLRSSWRLPNGVRFGARVEPVEGGANLELWLENGSDAPLTALRTQICLMLKEAPGFNEQNQERKEYQPPLTVVRARDADRAILLAFERCGRAWGNERCPCIHADPVLPDAAPGQRVSVQGQLRFFEGADLEAAKAGLRHAMESRAGVISPLPKP